MNENKQKTGSKKKQLVKSIGVLLSVVIIYFLVKRMISAWGDIEIYLLQANWALVVLAVFVYAICFILTGYNWAYMQSLFDDTLLLREYLNIHMVSVFAKYIPGGFWNILGKAYMCTSCGISKSVTSTTIVMEYIYQILSSMLFLLFFLPVLFENFSSVLLIMAIIIFIIVILALPFLIQLGIKILAKIFKETSIELCLSKQQIYGLLLRYIVVWIITGIGLTIWVMAFDGVSQKQIFYLVLTYPISWVIGFLSPSPNGLGVREGILSFLLQGIFPSSLLVLVTVTSRVWTILGEVLAFVIFKIGYFLLKKITINR